MSHDNWERLVRAVMRDEENRRIALWPSMESISYISSASSSFRDSSFSQTFEFAEVSPNNHRTMARSEPLVMVELLHENLKQLLVYNADLIFHVKNVVETLYGDLSLLKALLKDSTEKRSKNEALKELVIQIRNAVYEAEDAIDMYVFHVALSRVKKALNIAEYTKNLHKAAKGIQVARGKVSNIYQKKQIGFDLLHTGDGPEGSSKDKKAPIVDEDNVVGFDDEAKTVVGYLIGGSDELEVTSIVGMAGLGKTTLAKMIYRDPQIEYEFYRRAWVYVSLEYSRKEVFINILGYFTEVTEVMQKMNDENLAKELRKTLEKGKYLVVIDNVWTEQVWNDLKIGFPNNNNKSRILITSRIKKVGQHANPHRDPHDLRFLSPDESWKLLQLKTLGSEYCPEELIKTGTRIATQCEGLPLSIVVIGGILLEKGTDWWTTIAGKVDAYMAMDQYERVDGLIELSYNNLPYHLKACFIYLGMFPENFEIPVWKLIRLWIAEGFVQSKDGSISLEDIGEEYLEDLVNRNLVMSGAWRSNGKRKTCRVHDMLREFCKRVAEEEVLCQEIKWFDQGIYESSNPTFQKYRRLCIHTRVFDFILAKPVGQVVRSFLCFSKEEINLPAEHISSITGAFKLLRVLHAWSIIFSCFPADLTQLVHLRFIVISGTFNVLPVAISCLWNIQTFVVETNSREFDIKADLWTMKQLRHIKINASTTLPSPPSKGRKGNNEVLMSGSLQTLSTISPESCTEDMFSRAPNLKNLGIRGQLAKLMESNEGSTPFDSLGKLDQIENLKLLNDEFPFVPSGLNRLPQGYKFPPNLKKLTLSCTLLDWQNMSILGMLENLEIIKLKDNAFKGDYWQTIYLGFRSLKVLHIGRTDLVTWQAEDHHFPRLEQLCLRHCSNLSAIPLAFANISSLRLVEMYCTTKTAVSTARKVQEKILEKQNQMQGGRSTRSGGFKLSIYPPDQ